MRSAQMSGASFKTMFEQVLEMSIEGLRYEWNTTDLQLIGCELWLSV